MAVKASRQKMILTCEDDPSIGALLYGRVSRVQGQKKNIASVSPKRRVRPSASVPLIIVSSTPPTTLSSVCRDKRVASQISSVVIDLLCKSFKSPVIIFKVTGDYLSSHG